MPYRNWYNKMLLAEFNMIMSSRRSGLMFQNLSITPRAIRMWLLKHMDYHLCIGLMLRGKHKKTGLSGLFGYYMLDQLTNGTLVQW